MIDFSETLNDDQLGDIIQSIFNNFKKVIVQEFPLSKNCESIIIDANINKVFDFCTSFKFPLLGNEIISDVKFEGDPRKVGSKIKFLYLQKFKITNIVQEINVLMFDAGIQGKPMKLDEAKKNKMQFEVKGRGGTNFQAPIDYIIDNPRYDGLIIITDGYAPVPEVPPRHPGTGGYLPVRSTASSGLPPYGASGSDR